MNDAARPGQPDAPPGHLLGTVVRGVGLSGGGYAIAQALNLGVYIVLARLLSPREFGVFAAATVLIGFALLVTDSGLVSAVIQRRDRLEEAANTALVATTLNGLAFALVALGSAPLLGLFFDSSHIGAVAAVMSGMVLLRTLSSVPDALLQRQFSFVRRFAIEPVQVAAFGAAAIVSAAAGLGVWSLVIGQYAGTAADVALSWVFVRWRPRLRLASLAMWRELVGFGRHVFVSTTILKASEQADALIVGRIIGTAPLGQFRYGFRLAATPFRSLVAAASYVLFPAFARIADDPDRFRAAFHRSLRWVCLLAFPAGLALIPLGEPLAVLVFGERWRDAGHVAAAMCLFTGGGLISSVIAEALKATGQPRRIVRIYSVSAALTVAVMLAMAPIGLVAVAAGASVGAAGGAAYALFAAGPAFAVERRAMVADVWPPALAAILMSAAGLGINAVADAQHHAVAVGLLLVAGTGIAMLAVYAIALRLLSPVVAADVAELAAGGLQRLRGRRSPQEVPGAAYHRHQVGDRPPRSSP